MLRCSTALLGSSNMYILIFLAMQKAKFLMHWHVEQISMCASLQHFTPIPLCRLTLTSLIKNPALCRLQWPRWYLVPACQGCRPCSWLGELPILWRRGGGFDGPALAQGGPQRAIRSRLPPRGLQLHWDETSRASRSRFHWRSHFAGHSGFRCWACAGMGLCRTGEISKREEELLIEICRLGLFYHGSHQWRALSQD